MDSVISIVVFIAIYSVLAFIKLARKNEPGAESMDEVFPPIEGQEGEEYVPEYDYDVQHVPEEPARPASRPRVRPVEHTPAAPKEEPAASHASEPRKEKEKERVVFKDRSDAKRAFLYSEIFNRKY